MTATPTSKRAVFRMVVEQPEYHWPYYRLPATEYTAADLGALEHDLHRLASVWFKQEAHDDVEAFICWCPLCHLDFSPHDAHPTWNTQSKPVVPMVRALMLMDLHSWFHETVFVHYLDEGSDLVDALGFETRPHQTTMWRVRRERFSDDLLDAIAECVRNIRILAGENCVSVPPRKTDGTIESDAPRRGSSPITTSRPNARSSIGRTN